MSWELAQGFSGHGIQTVPVQRTVNWFWKCQYLQNSYASLQPLGNSGMATAVFLSIVDDKDKKGNAFSEK